LIFDFLQDLVLRIQGFPAGCRGNLNVSPSNRNSPAVS